MSQVNRHHLLYERNTYQRNRFLNAVRTHQGLILPLPIVEVHRPLHARIRHGVPTPDIAAAKAFMGIAEPYETGQPLFKTLDQAIGFFALTGNQLTAEHLSEQRDFIASRMLGEGTLTCITENGSETSFGISVTSHPDYATSSSLTA